jgi:DNA-directed RNA polymerase sigma subunit (sigma70/sigma32)
MRRPLFFERSKLSERASRSLAESCGQSRLAELQRRLLATLTPSEIEVLRLRFKDDPEAMQIIEEALPK